MAGQLTSRQLVDQLLADGMTKAEIARALPGNRNSSVISQITSGRKPWANLQPALEAVVANRRGANVAVPEPARRLDRHGNVAAVRKPTAGGRTVHVRSPGAIKSGAKSVANRLRIAERDGQRVAWTVVYPSWVEIGKSPKAKGTGHRPEPGSNVAELGNGGRGYPAGSFHRAVISENGNVGRAITKWLVAQNMLDTPDVTPLSIELRTWSPE